MACADPVRVPLAGAELWFCGGTTFIVRGQDVAEVRSGPTRTTSSRLSQLISSRDCLDPSRRQQHDHRAQRKTPFIVQNLEPSVRSPPMKDRTGAERRRSCSG